MVELKIGQEVEMEYGGSAKVLSIIGSGGQGIVYLVEFSEQVCDWLYALFYYFKDCFTRFKIRFLFQISH